MKSTITVNFILPGGEIISVEANEGETILQVAHLHELPLEGACGGALACSTCHVIVDDEWFEGMEVLDDENDMLDLAFGLQRTSRLGCQVVLKKNMDGIVIKIPSQSNNFDSDSGCCCMKGCK